MSHTPHPLGASTPHAIHVPWTHATQHSKLHLDRFSSFWTTVCKTVRPMLSDRCPVCAVCLSVCNVGVMWPKGWMDQDVTLYGGRPRSRPHCVRWGPS